MYVHAYQSRLWNAAASHRVQTFGAKKAVAGDLVLPSGSTEASPQGAVPAASCFHKHQCRHGKVVGLL